MSVPKEWIAENSAFLAEQWALAKSEILPMVGILIGLYVLSIALITVQSQLMAKITQGFLDKMRCKMFDGMQNLPIFCSSSMMGHTSAGSIADSWMQRRSGR